MSENTPPLYIPFSFFPFNSSNVALEHNPQTGSLRFHIPNNDFTAFALFNISKKLEQSRCLESFNNLVFYGFDFNWWCSALNKLGHNKVEHWNEFELNHWDNNEKVAELNEFSPAALIYQFQLGTEEKIILKQKLQYPFLGSALELPFDYDDEHICMVSTCFLKKCLSFLNDMADADCDVGTMANADCGLSSTLDNDKEIQIAIKNVLNEQKLLLNISIYSNTNKAFSMDLVGTPKRACLNASILNQSICVDIRIVYSIIKDLTIDKIGIGVHDDRPLEIHVGNRLIFFVAPCTNEPKPIEVIINNTNTSTTNTTNSSTNNTSTNNNTNTTTTTNTIDNTKFLSLHKKSKKRKRFPSIEK